ncbi:MAG: DNA polymerase IV [Actinobacteria bacterium]|nr:DNA polymerase IV [Actinomycetota bacterium]
MDAFYASVEQRDDPSLRGRPVVVGGAGTRGVVAAASYEARRFGIHSAMPMVRARRLCPSLVVVPPDFRRYRDASDEVMRVFRSVTPLVEPLSLDEAFLDVTGAVRLFGPPRAIADRIRAEVRASVDLPCSIGIAPNKFLAKLCSAKAKPDGVLHLHVDEVEAFLRPLPVSDLWGAGPKTVERLRSYGFRSVGQLADCDLRTLQRVLGDATGSHLYRLAQGRDARAVVPDEAAKSVSAEETFDEDIDDPALLRTLILGLAERVGRRLRASGLAGRTVTLKVRFATFDTITRSSTLDLPTDRTHDVADLARELFDGLRLERVRVRLLGVGVSNLTDGDAARQLSLDADPRWEDLERASDLARDRFGGAAVTFASLLDHEQELRSSNRDDLRDLDRDSGDER